MSHEEDIKPSMPTLSLAVDRGLANWINQSGVQKDYALLEVTEMLEQYIEVNYGKEYLVEVINKKLKEIKYSKITNYERLQKYLKRIRKKLVDAQVIYENMKSSKDVKTKLFLSNQIASKISPFQKELKFLFFVLLNVSGVQNRTIPRELLKSPEELNKETKSFDRKPPIGKQDGNY
jgi:hypothetical protein